MVFRLIPDPWARLWWVEDDVRDAAEDLREVTDRPHGEHIAEMLEVLADEVRQLRQRHEEELTDADTRCAEQRSAIALAPEGLVGEGGCCLGAEEGLLVVRYADSTSTEAPEFLLSDELYDSRPQLTLVRERTSE